MRDPAFVLLRFPIELVRTDACEFGKGREEDTEVYVVAEVNPDADEEAEIGDYDGRVQVVEGFGGLSVWGG